ncbi:AzlD domain-containing protein [Paenalkalicoccus suaedae]|uniref:AzlD domain-containing protein n=1 Tax=Paenalkalicoccus suaedae TaxID=2592382 RepID=A0A859FGK7_9BACI|nr:AzlD domain-containing protein [Paenalkalicoccus suaedae]QKS71784.1 AzlD domain-containing protein [Paenalkalicoccus suaedae]
MTSNMIWIIIGMGLVTYIPRILPLIVLHTETWPDVVRRMLARVPYAVLGALIFPGILFAYDAIWYGLIGGAVAILLASIGTPLIVVVGGAIVVLAGIQLMPTLF